MLQHASTLYRFVVFVLITYAFQIDMLYEIIQNLRCENTIYDFVLVALASSMHSHILLQLFSIQICVFPQ